MSDPHNINPVLARALEKKGYASLTEVQEAVIAPETDGRDLLVSAQTGSGKTVAFGLAITPTILGTQEVFGPAVLPQALVVAPTRELAIQVQRELTWLFGEAKGKIASCVGGMDPRAERRALARGAHVVVGTPGRLRDHIERGGLDMSGLRAVILDEADEMLDFGFREDLEFILDTAPKERRTLMFSATVPRTISNMAKRYQKDALRISTVSERGQHSDIEYRALSVAPSDKENAIINVLRYYDAESAIVFCKTRQDVNRLSSRFGNRGFSVVSLSGELSQNERTHALQAMRDGRARVCIATDVAARGIDLPGLELVIHADLPTNSDVLKHRSGRTGRAGKKGICALIVPHTMRKRAQRLLQGARLEVEWAAAPSLQEIQAMDTERLLTDPLLSQTYDEKALKLAQELLERHGAEQVAAAFLQQRQTDTPSAEELLDAPVHKDTRAKREKQQREREPFGDSVWFKMTAGRKERAEPSWLLPIICRLGHVTKREVGAIKIGETETRFEIKAKDAGRFIDAVAASGGGEKSIRITQEEGATAEWVPEVTSLERPAAPSKKKDGERSKSKPRKKEKWTRAQKNAAKKNKAKAQSNEKKKARKTPTDGGGGMDALIRKPKRKPS
ncbi:MAG: DEAD/DEAH box helicase [Rhodobiaceae bacterium]|nr:DEAD-box ATP-dependent RNA helicase CshA [Rhodobiaceae bacterium]MCR9240813.1 DEAD/DEAH box helicase [Rhodobiaceae bacterium]